MLLRAMLPRKLPIEQLTHRQRFFKVFKKTREVNPQQMLARDRDSEALATRSRLLCADSWLRVPSGLPA